MMNQRKRIEYPAATIAFYGPDNTRASKVVVGIIRDATNEPEPIRKWWSEEDIRADHKIGAQIRAFLREHGAKSVAMTDRIIGCPHEEGVDYPEGTYCPQCPFWKNRDRFTHELEE